MEFKNVKARCLFCHAVVEANQEQMAGQWESPEDASPRWVFAEEGRGKGWLWYVASDHNSNQQEFYLCPTHNDPHYFHSAMKWAHSQLGRGQSVDLTEIDSAPQLSPDSVEKWDYSANSLLKRISNPNNTENQPLLPDNWQVHDPRIFGGGCLDISDAVVDIFDSCGGLLLDIFDLPNLPKPLELAEAMEKAAKGIRLLTDKRG